jgi:HK97 family phage prohead protease
MTMAGTANRAEQQLLPPRPIDPFARGYALEDLHIRAEGGDGRVVEAYAAVFDVEAEVRDQDGHYHEVLTPTSFAKTLHERGTNFAVLYNHGLTVYGDPAPEFSVPIGVPLEVTRDERGVFTATRYLNNPLADAMLDGIQQGAVRHQSFTGRFVKSVKSWPVGRGRGVLPLITRHEVDLREYGPTLLPNYGGARGAAILGTRAEVFLRALLATPPEERLTFLERYDYEGLTTADGQPEALNRDTPAEGAVATVDEPTDTGDGAGHSARRHSHSIPLRTRIRVARIRRGMERGRETG